ncbi:uncharacterized protein LOC118197881 [Stegodyphus dumicola]|uniref:uncharacterized protein LOC118197881 n=1 Tax=Stegodyphus dumicola TaxID=202533 RepID=UPI0015AB844C|nr:uncharacterized protein LOC118197881 [Stegodyphus dumicola]
MEKVEEKASENNISKKSNSVPQNPTDMKSNVFGLQHDILMDRVIASKKKSKFPTLPTAVVSTENFPNNDLFSKIPGTAFQADIDRKNLIKQFHIERKVLKKHFENKDENPLHFQAEDDCDIPEEDHRDEDFIEEETSDRL